VQVDPTCCPDDPTSTCLLSTPGGRPACNSHAPDAITWPVTGRGGSGRSGGPLQGVRPGTL